MWFDYQPDPEQKRPLAQIDVVVDVVVEAEPDSGTIVYGNPGPSCDGMLGTECQGRSRCSNILVPGGTFPMGRSDNGSDMCPDGVKCYADELPEHDVTVSDFYLDEFEVTVGRFRSFVEQYDGTPPLEGAGAHPLVPGSGWQSAWNNWLLSSQMELESSTTAGNFAISTPALT